MSPKMKLELALVGAGGHYNVNRQSGKQGIRRGGICAGGGSPLGPAPFPICIMLLRPHCKRVSEME